MSSPHIALVGAGSASFGLDAVVGILRTPALHGAHLSLIDTDGDALEQLAAVARRLSDRWNAGAEIAADTDRRRVLGDADFVVISVAVDREATWQRDRAIAQAHGICHYGENGGPGGLFHAARNIATLLPILRDVEALAPDALVVNFTNPLPRLCRAIAQATSLRFVGLCHQLRFGYLVAGVALADALGIDVPDDYAFRWTDASIEGEVAIAHAAMERITLHAAGLNHFTWMLDIRDRATGASLLDQARHNLIHEVPRRHPRFEPLTRWLATSTGHVPVSGDTHLSEYLPYTARPEGWSRYEVQAYDHAWSERGRQARRRLVAELAAGRADPQPLLALPTERVEHLIAGVWHDTGAREEAVNVVNRPASPPAGVGGVDGADHHLDAPRAIDNLPDDAIVEVPGTLHRDGIRPEPVGSLPQPIAEWCRREHTAADLAVRAALEGRRDLARQALLVDPTIPDLVDVDVLLNAYLDAFGTQLGGRWR